jgi:hypothetical protein
MHHDYSSSEYTLAFSLICLIAAAATVPYPIPKTPQPPQRYPQTPNSPNAPSPPSHLPALTLNALASAALNPSSAKKLTKYSPRNLITTSLSPPSPASIRCNPASAPSPTGRLGCDAEPSVCPLDWNAAERAPAPPEESLAALRTAAVSADGFAPRIVSTTDEDLRTRKVGMLGWAC